jgi:hypothetical protein
MAAGEICGALGYDIFDRSSEGMAAFSAGGNQNTYAATAIKTNERSMLIACKSDH